ncbi:putative heparinase superfamily protein [Altererythrobacter atlanticus]|uniref:Heparinase II/III-like protein n=1 Tax=Croceibacterium atlanticum TaxID=1267766 RepID=A0A0F7KVM3_9SPHN|nr:heparinase II/III family protein [Croceibacterium atlanticum]AKH43211.1 Heparinase II/III-like protein [Croceibacterium atlanticum]MBB5732084.1 putative heparinase superfamily protein [Croceibacterium atlanticum]
MTDNATRVRDVAGVAAGGGADAMAIPLDKGAVEPLVKSRGVSLSDHGDDRPVGELIEPGRALALTDFDPPETTVGERLMRLAYRFGVPGSALVSPFRKPAKIRLLATVDSPLEGDRVAGMALRAGHFLVHGVKVPIAQVDFSPVAKLTPPVELAVHGFSWLRDLNACGQRPQCTQTAERVLAAWLEHNARPGKGAAWRVGIAGQRLLAWLVHAPLILSGSDKNLKGATLASIEETARWLDRNVTRADDRLGEMAGWCAITAAGLLLPEGKPRRLFGEAGLARVLGELVGNDGGVLSRSPLGQIEAIGLLVDLAACYRAVRRDPPQAVEGMLQMLVPPLLALTHSDGGLGNWQGAGAVSAERLSALIGASGVRTRPLRDSRQWGYQRVSAGRSVLHFDAAPPPLARHARHGCASTLAFEFSHGAHRLIVNCGGSAFAGGLVPVRIEQGLRATAAHSTLVLGDSNSTAVMINGKLGSGVGEVEVDRRTIEFDGGGSATRLEASHDGYAGRFGLIHRRILLMRDDGTELRGEDLLIPSGRKGKRGKVPFAIRFHLGSGIEISLTANKRGATLALPDGGFWQFVASEGTLEVDESIWTDGDGRPHPVQQLVLQGLISRGGGNFSWLLKKMR